MKVFIAGWYHPKNRESLIKSCEILGWEQVTNISDANVVFSGDKYFDTKEYPEKRFVFGPHFCVIPNSEVRRLSNERKNAVYIQPSFSPVYMWVNEYGVNNIGIRIYPFGVNTEKFCPSENTIRDQVFVYYKRRDPKELDFLVNFLVKMGIKFRLIEYGKYTESDYIEILNTSVYGIWLGSHESQGFALEEALSMGVPLLVWSTRFMKQEYGSFDYDSITTNSTSVPYWDTRCGAVFYSADQLEYTWQKFQSKLPDYDPRGYIIETLSMKKRAESLKNLVESIDGNY